MIDIDKYLQAIQINWIKRLKESTNNLNIPNWTIVPRFYFNKFGENFLIFNFNLKEIRLIENLKESIPHFYHEILKTWSKAKNSLHRPQHELNFREIS